MAPKLDSNKEVNKHLGLVEQSKGKSHAQHSKQIRKVKDLIKTYASSSKDIRDQASPSNRPKSQASKKTSLNFPKSLLDPKSLKCP